MSGSTPDPVAPGTTASDAEASRLSPVIHWLHRRADTSPGRLVLIWFRRYFEASRNSGAAASAYITVSVLPTALVIIAFSTWPKGTRMPLPSV